MRQKLVKKKRWQLHKMLRESCSKHLHIVVRFRASHIYVEGANPDRKPFPATGDKIPQGASTCRTEKPSPTASPFNFLSSNEQSQPICRSHPLFEALRSRGEVTFGLYAFNEIMGQFSRRNQPATGKPPGED